MDCTPMNSQQFGLNDQSVTGDPQSFSSNTTTRFDNFFKFAPFLSDNSSSFDFFVRPRTTSQLIEDVIYEQLIVAICALGLVGNILNMLILGQKSLLVNMERMERSANYGLLGLALSDALLCLSNLPTAVVNRKAFGYKSYDFRILYAVYSEGVVNTFVLSSAWLTVCMAVSRYLVVCYPFKARLIVGKRFAVTSLLYVFIASVVFNIPRYYMHQVGSMECQEGGFFYFTAFGALTERSDLRYVYEWISFVVGIALPFATLAFCNVKLIIALQRSSRMSGKNMTLRSGSGSGGGGAQDNHGAKNRITLMMILIVSFYLFLVVPAETAAFLRDEILPEDADAFDLLTAILNLFQAVNFAFNFILYCAVNAYFRRTLLRLVRCVGVNDLKQGTSLAMYEQRAGAARRGTDYSGVGYVATCKTDVNATTIV